MPGPSRSRWPRRWRYLVACAAIGLGLAVGLAVVLAPRSESSNGLSRFSNGGQAVRLSSLGRQRLTRMGSAGALRLMAVRGRRAFFRLAGPSGDCLSVGKAGAAGATPGVTFCPAPGTFPSPSMPVVALPLVDAARSSRQGAAFDPANARLIRLDGFAADGVAEVEFQIGGHAAVSARVAGNVFSLPVAGLSANGDLVARNAQGQAIFRHSY